MSLQDQHLQQALKNAPDRDMMPNDATRAAVLTYANKAVKRRQDTRWKRMSDLMQQRFGFNLHSVGLGSAVATVLIVVFFWHEQLDDTIWRAAAPSEERKIGDSVNESSVQNVPAVTSVEKTLDAATSNAVAPAQKSSAKVAENKAAINIGASRIVPSEIASSQELSSKAKLLATAASSSRESAVNTEQTKLKNSGLAEAIPQAAPAAIEPEMPATIAVAASAPAVVASSAEAPSKATKGELAKELQVGSDASLKMRREDIVAKKSAAKTDVLGASAPNIVTKPQENLTLLVRIKNEGGKALANQDIQTGNLRLLKVEIQPKDFDALNCSQLTSQTSAIDPLTGFKVYSLGSCDATALLQKEVEVYNQTMREWQSNHSR